MQRVEQILVPLDFSSFGRCALALAAKLGSSPEKLGDSAHLQLAHAVEAMPPYVRSVLFPYAPLGEDDRQFEAEIAEAVRQEMEHYFELDDHLGERFIDEPAVEFGAAARWLRRWESHYDVDLIVMGASGEGGAWPGGPGSTSRRTAELASHPVILVRDYEPDPTVGRILVAVDLGEGALDVLEAAVGLAADLNAQLEVLHVVPSPFANDTRGLVSRQIEVDQEALMRSAEAIIEGHLEQLKAKAELPEEVEKHVFEAVVRWGDPAREIGARTEEGEFDLVVIGRGTSGGLGRVCAAVVAEVPRHLMVVPVGCEGTVLAG